MQVKLLVIFKPRIGHRLSSQHKNEDALLK